MNLKDIDRETAELINPLIGSAPEDTYYNVDASLHTLQTLFTVDSMCCSRQDASGIFKMIDAIRSSINYEWEQSKNN